MNESYKEKKQSNYKKYSTHFRTDYNKNSILEIISLKPEIEVDEIFKTLVVISDTHKILIPDSIQLKILSRTKQIHIQKD